MDWKRLPRERWTYFLLAAVAGFVAFALADNGRMRQGAETGGACGFAVAAGLCVLAGALVREDRGP
jgi:hypothetical protein